MGSVQSLGQGRGRRDRVGRNRLGTLLVLAVTAAALVAGVAYLVDRASATPAGLQATTLSGPVDGAPPKIGSPPQDFTRRTVDGKEVWLSSYKGHLV